MSTFKAIKTNNSRGVLNCLHKYVRVLPCQKLKYNNLEPHKQEGYDVHTDKRIIKAFQFQ